MVSTDPIADMLTRIRNALAVNIYRIEVPHSNLKYQLANQLKKVGFIKNVSESGEGVSKVIVLELRDEDEASRITLIERVSKPGRRLYAKAGDIPRVMNGRGVMIVSTSKGLMSDREARAAGVGGELICKVY